MFGVQANVIKGGNRMMEIVAHVVCRDENGQVRWEDDAKLMVIMPHGDEVPQFVCEGVTCKPFIPLEK